MNFKEARKLTGLTLEQVSEKANYGKGTISDLENKGVGSDRLKATLLQIYGLNTTHGITGPSRTEIVQLVRCSEYESLHIQGEGYPPQQPASKSGYALLENNTLFNALIDLAKRLQKAPSDDRKYIIGNLVEAVSEIQRREVSSRPLSEAGQILKQAGDRYDQKHGKA